MKATRIAAAALNDVFIHAPDFEKTAAAATSSEFLWPLSANK